MEQSGFELSDPILVCQTTADRSVHRLRVEFPIEVASAGGKIDRLRNVFVNDQPFAAGVSHSRRSANHFGGAD